MRALIALSFFTILGPAQAGDLLPRAFVQNHPSVGATLVVDKARAQLDLYDFVGSDLRRLKSFPIASGKQHGSKQNQGDLRTPEGIYFFSEYKPDSALASKYGVGAYVTDYPNPFDVLFHKSGSGIWLHGTDNTYRIPVKFDSEGCVVVYNQDFQEISRHIRINQTPIIIYNETPMATAEDLEPLRASLKGAIEGWRTAWEQKRHDDYMEAYSRSFQSRGMGWAAWKAYKRSIGDRPGPIKVGVDDLRIYSVHPYAYASFVQRYESPSINDSGNKRLGLRYEDGKWRIVSEFFFKDETEVARKVSSSGTETP